MLEKKVQGIICITQKRQKKSVVGKRRNFEKLQDVQKKCRRCLLVLAQHIVALSVPHLLSFLDTEKPKYLRTLTLKLIRVSEMSQTLRLLVLCISC